MAELREMLGLQGKRALVIGGGAGIGACISLRLAEAGCDVAVCDFVADNAAAVTEQVRALGVEGVPVVGDVLRHEDVPSLVAAAEGELGGIDVLVNIVGVSHWASLIEMPLETWNLDHELNLRQVFLISREVAKLMVSRRRPGVMTCVTSVSGIQAAPNHAAYGAAKAGLVQLVRSMAVEWADHGIRVNSVGPGSIVTPRLPRTEARDNFMRKNGVPLARRGEADEVAKAILFLSSNMASYITGQNLMVDGGWSAANLCVRADIATP
ncbi:SDR family oxidoreductase [Sphingobium sp. V4]|uniref:SDR family NAD(P)-dependent oxidoreductase n=1 Tax=Sphingobium sp. V4 TaxID=3038927 RepID=UPI002557D0E4|nr:SDR family oxidoreductase [Sphingobium sp. V4]WIW89460.1 SDR family oxidoreductase [Sphingobium sp. V4]